MRPLQDAIENGDINKIRKLLALPFFKKIFLNSRDGNTPLETAIDHCRLDIVQLLVEAGANINTKSASQHTPLHYACTLSDEDGYEIVRYLINHGADINAKSNEGRTDVGGKTPLHWAVEGKKPNTKIVALLLQKGAIIDAQRFIGDDKQETPAYDAAYYNNKEMVDILIRSGCNPYINCFKSEDPIKPYNILNRMPNYDIAYEQLANEASKASDLYAKPTKEEVNKRHAQLSLEYKNTCDKALGDIDNTLKTLGGGIPKLAHLAFLSIWKKGIPIHEMPDSIETVEFKNVHAEIFSKVPGSAFKI